MKRKDQRPCSQEPAAGPYPEPEKSNPLLTYYFKINFNIIFASTPLSTHRHIINSPCVALFNGFNYHHTEVGACGSVVG